MHPMPVTPDTPHYRMADRCVDGQLATILLTLEAEGLSLRQMTLRLYATHGVEVTHTTLSNWLRVLHTEAVPS